MKKQYIFVGLILIFCYLIFLIGNYKLREYKIMKYIDELSELNNSLELQIDKSLQTLDKIQTKAYINKSLKKDAGLLNPGEESITLISESQYANYISPKKTLNTDSGEDINPNSSESLIATMTNYQKWIYFFFKKDIR